MRRNKNKSKQFRAIYSIYGSKFLHKVLDLEKRLEKATELSRKTMLGLLGCCVLISGTLHSLTSRSKIPLFWIFNGIFKPSGLLMTIILFSISILVIYCVRHYQFAAGDEYDEERNLTKSAHGTHGTASFLEGEEIKKVYGLHTRIEDVNGFIIGKVPNISQNIGYIGDIVTRDEDLMKKQFLSNRNTVIIGSPGTGKSAAIMIPNLIESAKRGESVFVTDPKGELCDKTYPIFKELGYTVKVFNLIYPWDSNKWNFMAWLSTLGAEKEKWITTISAMIIKNTSGERPDEFWSSTADKLLKALMSILLEIASPIAKIKDDRLTDYTRQIKELRNRRLHSKSLEEKNLLNNQIEQIIKEKYNYLTQRLKQVQKLINTCNVPSERQRLTDLYYKIQSYRNDEMLLPIMDKSNPPEDYEPMTIAEAKHRILNISTCVKLLQLRISLTKEEQSAMTAFNATPRFEKVSRLLYELVFKVPYEQRSYKALHQVFAISDPNHSLAFSYWSSFTESSENVCTSVKGGLDTRLSAFKQHYIQQMVSENDIDLEKPGKEKCAYFCIISDQETSLAYISSLFITIAFATLQAQADANSDRKLKVRTMFYLDEFANIGVLPDYTKKLSTLRSRDIHILMAVQNLPQLLQRYDENLCLEMFGDCDLMLFLGCGNEDKTPEFVSNLMGKMTTSTIVKRETKNILSPIKDFNVGMMEQQGQRDLMYINEIRELNQNRLIALTRGQKPMQVEKFMYFQRPDFDWIEQCIAGCPTISGHPLPSEQPIDLDCLLTSEFTAYSTLSMDDINVSDMVADQVDYDLNTAYKVERMQEVRDEFLRLKTECNSDEEFEALVNSCFKAQEATDDSMTDNLLRKEEKALRGQEMAPEGTPEEHPKAKIVKKLKIHTSTIDPKDL